MISGGLGNMPEVNLSLDVYMQNLTFDLAYLEYCLAYEWFSISRVTAIELLSLLLQSKWVSIW